jgi:hypothetical protein
MKKLALMFALVVPMAACGGGAAGEIMKKMKDTKAKVCACKDEACVEAVKKDVAAWMEKNESKFKDFKPSKSQMEALDKIDEEIDKCEEKFEKKAEPTPPPPADPVPTPPPADPAAPAPADPAAPAGGTAAPAGGTAAPAAPAPAAPAQ